MCCRWKRWKTGDAYASWAQRIISGSKMSSVNFLQCWNLVLGRFKGAYDLALPALHKEVFNSKITGANSYETLCILQKLCDFKKDDVLERKKLIFWYLKISIL